MSLQPHPDLPDFWLIQNSLMASSLTTLRRITTPDIEFAATASRMAPFVVYEALYDLRTKTELIETPVSSMQATVLDCKPITLVSILGAGQALLHNVRQSLLPWASEAYIAASRDEASFEPTLHYDRLPGNLSHSKTVVLDPMLASGGSSSAVIQLLKDNCHATDIMLICIVAAYEGVMQIQRLHPGIKIVAVALDDKKLTEKKFIDPGLGDFGDRFTGVTPKKR